MKSKLVAESLDQLLEEKKMADVSSTKSDMEKSKAKKQPESKKSKAEQAIEALKAELVKAKKPGAFRTTTQKNGKIKEIEDKIASWKKKIE